MISMLWLAQKSFWGKFGILTVHKLVHSLLKWYCRCVCPSLWSPRLQINTKRDWIKSWHASKNSLNLKPSKHCFLREGVTYIGCQLLAIGVFSHIDKIVTAQDWQVPNHVKASFQHELKTNKHLDVPFANKWNTVCQPTLRQCRVTSWTWNLQAYQSYQDSLTSQQGHGGDGLGKQVVDFFITQKPPWAQCRKYNWDSWRWCSRRQCLRHSCIQPWWKWCSGKSLQIRNQNLQHADPQDQLQASKKTQTGSHVQQQEWTL